MEKKFNPRANRSCKPSGVNDLNYPTGKRPSESFQDLQEAFALLGFTLQGTDSTSATPTYFVERLGLVRVLPSLRDASIFLRKLKELR